MRLRGLPRLPVQRATPTSATLGMSDGVKLVDTFTATDARTTPRDPPATVRSRLSLMKARITWSRLAPTATRSATSRWRTSARTNRRLATLAHAMTSTRPTVPRRIHRVRLTSPTIWSLSGRTTARSFTSSRNAGAPSSGNNSARRPMSPCNSVSAPSSVAASESRAIPVAPNAASGAWAGSTSIGMKSCTSALG